jgi:kynurenine formamidase
MRASANLLLLLPLMLGACATGPADRLGGGIVIDLSYAYDEDTIYWPTAEGFRHEAVTVGHQEGGYYYEAFDFQSAEHGGTHIDAPRHFAEGKQTVDEIPLERLMGPGIVIDVAAACARDRDYQVTTADFEAWEADHGRIPEGAIVLLRTGFGRFWPDRVRYMGTAERGPEAVADLHFPGLHADAARWLATRRSIGAIGLDTPSIDHGQSKLFESHCILFERQIPALENVARLDELPPEGFDVIALPMKIRGGSGAPVRIAAILR